MKYYPLILCLFLSSILSAQIDFSATTFSGYETNILQVPDLLEVDGELLEQEDLYANSAYQELILHFKYSKEWGKHSFAAYVTPEIRYYFTESDLNQTIFNTRFTHKYLIKKNFRWENSLRYKIKDREGQNLDQVELSVPFGYKLFELTTGLRFRLYKNNRTFVKANFLSKDFDNSSTRSVMYNLYGINTEFKNIKWRNHLLHSYGIKLGYNSRDYKITNFSDNSSGDRTWNYFDAGIFYRLPLSKKLYIQPEFSYQKRMDKTNDRFTYGQIRPELTLAYQSARFEAKVITSYTSRSFSNITAENEDGNTVGDLKYDYLRLRTNLKYNVHNKLSLVFESYLIDRNSNNTDLTTQAFRSYVNNYVGIGLKYIF